MVVMFWNTSVFSSISGLSSWASDLLNSLTQCLVSQKIIVVTARNSFVPIIIHFYDQTSCSMKVIFIVIMTIFNEDAYFPKGFTEGSSY